MQLSDNPNYAYRLDRNEIAVVLALQAKPLATFEEIAEITRLPKSTVFNTIKHLESLSQPPLPPLFRVNGMLNDTNLGLEIVDAIVSVKNSRKLTKISQICDVHPYPIYRARCFGDVNGYLFQFRIPQGTYPLVENLFQQLKTNDYFDDFTLLQFKTPTLLTSFQYQFWDEQALCWTFNWGNWFEKPLEMSPELGASITNGSTPAEKVTDWLKKDDITILKELYLNSRRKNTDLLEALKKRGIEFTPQTFSRRLKQLQDTCIKSYRLYLNSRSFDIVNTLLIWGYGDPKKLEQLRLRNTISPIPFQSTFKADQYKFYWYLQLPTGLVSDLLYQLEKQDVVQELHYLFVDHFRSEWWYPDEDTFDEDKKDWKRDSTYLVDNVIQALNRA